MVVSAIISSVAALLGAAIGGYVTYLATKKAQEAENQRFEAKYLIEDKYEKITKLHENLSECDRMLKRYYWRAGNGNLSVEEYESSVVPLCESLRRAMFHAEFYMNGNSLESTDEAFGYYTNLCTDIGDVVKSDNPEEAFDDISFDTHHHNEIFNNANSEIKEEVKETIYEFEGRGWT